MVVVVVVVVVAAEGGGRGELLAKLVGENAKTGSGAWAIARRMYFYV